MDSCVPYSKDNGTYRYMMPKTSSNKGIINYGKSVVIISLRRKIKDADDQPCASGVNGNTEQVNWFNKEIKSQFIVLSF